LAVILPWSAKRAAYQLLGWEIHPSARVGLSFIDAERVVLGPEAQIGHFNVLRGLKLLSLEDAAYIRHFNTATATYAEWPREMSMGSRATVMNFHYFDVGGRLRLHRDVTVGGRNTQFWTHQLKSVDGVRSLEWGEVSIGALAYIGTRCTVLPGANLPPGATLAAGSVLGRQEFEVGTELVAGNPAKRIR
jgi:acetyltransferase-like isoleucine patch superfamily enzyme